MILRFISTLGLFVAGYYLGREVGRQESVRDDLKTARENGTTQEIGPDNLARADEDSASDGEKNARSD